MTVEDQERADERISHLLVTPAAVHFLSIEPMLGPVNILPWLYNIDWVIVGAESGAKRRPMKLEWVRAIVDQCRMADVPVFVKQLHIDGTPVKNIEQFPEDLQIQEYPQ